MALRLRPAPGRRSRVGSGRHCSPGGGPHLADARADGWAGQTRDAGHGADTTATQSGRLPSQPNVAELVHSGQVEVL